MFFILSKILTFIINPLVWIFSLFIYSLFSKKKKRKKRVFIIGLVIFYIFSNSFFLDEAMRIWEVKAKSDNQYSEYEYGIVLGGMASYDSNLKRVNFARSSDRLWHALRLYKNGTIKKLFLTGGSGSVLQQDNREAVFLKNYLKEIGVRDEDIIIEKESKNTRENALNTAKLLKNKKKQRHLLISSGFHLRRAKACFDKVELETDVYSTDRYAGNRKFIFDHVFIPAPETLFVWSVLIHEISGYCVYWIVDFL